MVFLSERLPPRELLQTGPVAVLDWPQLRLSDEEAAELVTALTGTGSEPLVRAAAGWVTALVLGARRWEQDRYGPVEAACVLVDATSGFLTERVLARAPVGQTRFLAVSALLPTLWVDLVAKLTGEQHAAAILSELYQQQMFTERLESWQEAFRFHPLFRRFLLEQGKASLQSAELNKLRRRARLLLEAAGHAEDAIRLLHDAEDWKGLLHAIARHAPGQVRQGRAALVRDWLHGLPEQVVAKEPWVHYWRGVCATPESQVPAVQHLREAYRMFRERQDMGGSCAAWAATADALMAAGELQPLDDWIQQAEQFLSQGLAWPSKDAEVRLSLSMLVALMQRGVSRDSVDAWAERVERCLGKTPDIAQQVAIVDSLVTYCVWFAGPSRAAVLLDRLRHRIDLDAQPQVRIHFHVADAESKWLSGKYTAALQAVTSGLELAESAGSHASDFRLTCIGARASLAAQAYREADEWLQRLARAEPKMPAQRAEYHLLSAWSELMRGHHSMARERAERSAGVAEEAGTVLLKALAQAVLAHVHLVQGQKRNARRILPGLRRTVEQTGSPYLDCLCTLTEAWLESGQGARAAALLAKGFSIAREHGYDTVFWWNPTVLAELTARALQLGLERDYLTGLVRRRDLVPSRPPIDVESWPWALKVYTLGRFSLVVSGRPVTFVRKAQHKPLDLLKVLIAFGGREVSEELLTSVLWPDAEGDAAHNTFDTTLHRLRKLIGSDRAIQLQDHRLTLDNRYCWVDVWAFERLLNETESVLASNYQREADRQNVLHGMFDQVVGMYQGHFLGKEAFQPWSISLRERLRSKLLRQIGQVGTYWETVRDWEYAVRCYQKGLELDDLAETFYQRLMICYDQLGRRSEALSVYRRCRTTLSIVLGIEPTPATKAIRKQIISGRDD